ncbi:MAG: hypothetical protein ACE10F_11355, partial [Candidatus Methylomirabilales bacterium]
MTPTHAIKKAKRYRPSALVAAATFPEIGPWELGARRPKPRSGAGDLSTGLPAQRKRCCGATGPRGVPQARPPRPADRRGLRGWKRR